MEDQKEQKKSVGVIAHLATLTAMQIADDERVKNKFISMVEAIHGPGMANAYYEAEKHYFTKLILENKDLQQCTRLSLYGAFIDCAINRLSFDPSKKLAYLLWDNHNVGTKDQPQYEKRARCAISPYGELFLRQEFGQIRGADSPEVVYEGEQFTKITGKDGTMVNHVVKYPRPNTPVVAAYVRIIKIDGSIDYKVMDLIQMERLKQYSATKNRGYPSHLYGTKDKPVDTGFMIAKCIKHAFTTYPKVKPKGDFTVLETELEPDPTDGPVNYEDVDDPKKDPDPKPETEHKVNITNVETATMTMTEDPKPETETKQPIIERKVEF